MTHPPTQPDLTAQQHEQRRREHMRRIAKLLRPAGRPPKRIVVNGTPYPSRTAAANALGISYRHFNRMAGGASSLRWERKRERRGNG